MKSIQILTRDAGGAGLETSKVITRLAELAKKPLQRQASILRESIDVEARTAELSFSSEIEYERWFGIEILDHSAGAVRMGRITDGAALLWNHNWDDQRGVVESARIDSDRKGRATVRFSRSEAGEQLFQDVADGIVTKVSVGYLVHGLKLQEERGDLDVYRVTDWEPFEISMVSVPADATVGIGRGLEIPREEQTAETTETATSITKPTEQTRTRNNMDQNTPAAPAINAQAERQAGADAERNRVRAIADMGREYGKADMAQEHIVSGKSPEDFQRALLADFAAARSNKPLDEQQKPAMVGMSDKEVRQFSLMRAIRAMANPEDAQLRKAAAFEFEASRAAADLYGKQPKGVIIPNDVLASRAFTTTTGTGSNIIGTELQDGSFISMLRKRAWVMRRARTLAGLVGNVQIPRQNATGSAYWVGEGSNVTASNMGVDQINFTPKTVGAMTEITRRLMNQSTPDAEMLVRDDLLTIMGLEIDRAAIYGSGTASQPLGLNGITGIPAVALATAATPLFSDFVKMETLIAAADADVENMSYSFAAGIRGYAKTALKFPGAAGTGTIWEPGNTVNGYATNVSNQIAAGDVFFGNWNDMIVALWGGLELTVDPYSLSASGGLRLVALQDIDVNIRHKESFVIAR
jgi:HK97 family phage major capsid protein/HK97 family phage prohead protease